MSRVRKNVVTHGLSGKVDALVFRQRNGKTFVSTAPIEKERKFNASQLSVQSAFTKAAKYAKAAISNPVMKQAYHDRAKPGQSAYIRAVADYHHPPEIGEIDHSNYNGQIGSIISSLVTDDFRVASVHYKIEKPDGSLLEQGNATADPDCLHWIYSATVLNSNLAGSKITVTAKDLPGNSISNEKTI